MKAFAAKETPLTATGAVDRCAVVGRRPKSQQWSLRNEFASRLDVLSRDSAAGVAARRLGIKFGPTESWRVPVICLIKQHAIPADFPFHIWPAFFRLMGELRHYREREVWFVLLRPGRCND